MRREISRRESYAPVGEDSPSFFFFFFFSIRRSRKRDAPALFTIWPPFKKIRFTRILVSLEFTKSRRRSVKGGHGEPGIAWLEFYASLKQKVRGERERRREETRTIVFATFVSPVYTK